ncbi:MAG TPA: branched-chain amino acid ABC transporter permease [Candidatus Limnocylindrales bacterium]|nr:branched-chain amino acid ABC transporter permease [Candidatus Limnocylindrales bacterium]
MTTAAAAGSGAARARPDLGRWSTPIALAVALAVVYLLMVLGAGAQAQEQFINALTIGAIYALIALGYTMVYGIIELINFAHGEIFMCGSFVSWWLLTTLGFSGAISDPIVLVVVLVLAFVVSMVVMGVVGVVIERLAYRPLRNAPRLAPLITAIGVSFILQNIIFVGISNSIVTTPQIIPNPTLTIGPVVIRAINLFVIVLALALMTGLQLFINRTALGRAMRSTAIDREAAQIMGVDINSTIALTFFIGSALAGAAGVVQGLYFGVTVFNIGFQAGLKAFTAAVLGGIGNTTGAAIGGFVIGFIEVLASVFGFGRWSEAAVFTTLVLVLIFRPTGILGQQLADRA